MKNIYECYNVKANSEFQILCQDDLFRTILWMAPQTGTHDVRSIISRYSIDFIHVFLIPENCYLPGMLWQKYVGAKQPPGILGWMGKNIILEQPYEYGMCVRL